MNCGWFLLVIVVVLVCVVGFRMCWCIVYSVFGL